jgi:hypothetical protein
MNTINNKTFFFRLFAVILFAMILGTGNIGAQGQQQGSISFNCDPGNGGYWALDAHRFGPSDVLDGQGTTYTIYFSYNNCFQPSSIVKNIFGYSDINMFTENHLINIYNSDLVFDGWVNGNGVPVNLDDMICNNSSIYNLTLYPTWRNSLLVEPTIEWSVSVDTPSDFQPKSNNGTTSVDYGSSIYLKVSLIPVIQTGQEFTYQYYYWSVDYHTSDNEYFYSQQLLPEEDFLLAAPHDKSGKTTYTIDAINFFHGVEPWVETWVLDNKIRYEYTLEVGPMPAEPTLPNFHWFASINSSNSYRSYANNSSITIKPEEFIHMRFCPAGGTINYDSWSFNYTEKRSNTQLTTNRISAGSCFTFNNGLPYDNFEMLEFEITGITFYLNGSQVRSIQTPYSITVSKEGSINPSFDLFVSVNNGSYSPQNNNSKLILENSDEISLRVCLTGGNYTYDQWSVDYEIEPSGLNESAPLTPFANCFNFNNGEPYRNFKEIKVNITALRIYSGGDLINTIQLESPYLFVVQAMFEGIDILPVENVCTNMDNISIPFNLLYTEHKIQYSVHFTEDAKKAGFNDIVNLTDLPDVSKIVINMPNGVPEGIYSGIIRLHCDEEPLLYEEYTFSFQIIEDNIEITRHPLLEQSTCKGSLIELSAAISGTANSYQWYHNGQAIPGANNLVYYADKGGSYYVEITGNCLPIRSQTAIVNIPESDIKVKWNDFLYVENPSEIYERYQWYRNGIAINGATHIYFTDDNGLSGDYSVRSYRYDGTFDETCPVTFSNGSKASVYPSVLRNNESLNIVIQNSVDNEQATVEIFSITGALVRSTQINESTSKINTNNLYKGTYIVKITLSSGKVFNEKIVVL